MLMSLTDSQRKWSQLSMGTSIRLTRQLFHWLRTYKYCYYYYWIEWGFRSPSPSLSHCLSLSLALQKFTPVDYLKTNFSFRFCPVRLPICVHMSFFVCVRVCVSVRVCFCRCYGNQYLNSVRSFSPCCVRLSPWTFKNKIQTHSTRSTTQ